MNSIVIYTDGSCLGNPGKGGWAAILSYQKEDGCLYRKELSGGFEKTTNNRMEILAVVNALSALHFSCHVDLYTDSQYVAKAIKEKWLANWQRNGWKTASKKPVKNKDLWERMSEQLARHEVQFHWLKGHAGHPENERCDELARFCACQEDLSEDVGFIETQT